MFGIYQQRRYSQGNSKSDDDDFIAKASSL